MKLLSVFLMALLAFPLSASATGLQLFPTRPKEAKVAATASKPASFSGFRVEKTGSLARWTVTVRNRWNQPMPANHYDLRVSQLDIAGRSLAAGEALTVTQTIPAGGTIVLSGEFPPDRNLAKLQFEMFSRSDGTVLGQGAFSTGAVAARPGGQAAPAAGAAATFGSDAPPTLATLDIKLALLEVGKNSLLLTVTNAGSETLSLRNYEFMVTANLLMRPDRDVVASFSESSLGPGQSAKSNPLGIAEVSCANLDAYTVRVRSRSGGPGLEETFPVEPYAIDARVVRFNLKSMEKGVNEYSTLAIIMEIVNRGSRVFSSADFSGTLYFKSTTIDPTTRLPMEFVFPVHRVPSGEVAIPPGERQNVQFTLELGCLTKYGVLLSRNYLLYDKKPSVIEIVGRVGSRADCGVPVHYTDDISWQKEY